MITVGTVPSLVLTVRPLALIIIWSMLPPGGHLEQDFPGLGLEREYLIRRRRVEDLGCVLHQHYTC